MVVEELGPLGLEINRKGDQDVREHEHGEACVGQNKTLVFSPGGSPIRILRVVGCAELVLYIHVDPPRARTSAATLFSGGPELPCIDQSESIICLAS